MDTTEIDQDALRDDQEKPKNKAQKIYEWITGRVPAQINVTPTLAITVTATLSLTFAMSVYGIVNLIFHDTGWEISEAQASTSYSVLISEDVVIEQDLVVQKNLMVQDDLRILGSVLDMASSSCETEGLSPEDTVRVCFEEADAQLKVSKNGGPYTPILTHEDRLNLRPVIAGTVGPVDPAGLAGSDGISCWDLNSDGIPGPGEDINRDSAVDVLDCRGAQGVGLAGKDGLNCWDLDGDGKVSTLEDINRDFQVDALDCRGSQGITGPTGLPGQDGLHCWDSNENGRADPSEDANGDRVTDILDCQGISQSMRGLIDLPQGKPCAEVIVSQAIRDVVANNSSLISVQLTSRGRWWPLYAEVNLPSVSVCQDELTGGTVYYDIQAVR
ncbi:MAG: hypothetical protein O2909_03735 [Chloroflexi bacterium]|nr:hypothetical protein [Chloroflexota bacterium]MDA1218533.1 hypothetical protein [Chloroflexota bacterium]